MTEFEGQVLADLSVLQSQMKQLIGIGQPGRLNQLEERVERHERTVQRLKGRSNAVYAWRPGGSSLGIVNANTGYLES